MSVYAVRRIHDNELMFLAYTKKAAAMHLQRRIDDGRYEGPASKYLITKVEE